MNSVFSRIFMGMFFTSLLILIIISLIITFAIQTSISTWNQGKQEDFQTLLIPIISKIHRLNGGLTEGNIEEALTPYLTDSLFVYVFDQEKNPIYLFNQGKRISIKEFGEDKNALNAGISKLPLVPISDGNEIIAFLASDAIDFLADQANRDFISTMTKAVSAGISITLIFTLVISGLISSGFSKQTGLLVEGIFSLSNGNRHVSFPELKIKELDEISRSALNLQNQLTKEEQLRRQWMEDISHDLRTPMTAVISQFEAMVDGALDIGQSRLTSLLSEIRRIEALILNLQELSRYESPEMTINNRTISSTDFLEDIHDRFSFLSGQKNIRLICRDPGNTFIADEHLLQRCISNIIQNALQHTESGGKITVEIAADSPHIRFRILNTGHIPEKDINSIFDRLYRGSQARSGGGSGLGLSIAKAIVDLHKGTIKARNVNDSVEFSILIPGEKQGV